MRKQRRFLWFKRLLLLAGVLLLCLVAAEIAARTVLCPYADAQFLVNEGRRDNLYRLAPKIGYEMIPNAKPWINNLGMHGPKRSKEKPKGAYRILVLGDSIAFGIGVKHNETFSADLERRLRLGNPGHTIEVLNGGVIGYNTEQEYNYLVERGLELEPDAVVLAYCPNDTMVTPIVFKEGHSFRFYQPGTERQRYNAFLVEHSALYRLIMFYYERRKLQNAGVAEDLEADSVLKSILFDSAGSMNALKDMAGLLKSRSIRFVVVIFPYLMADFTEYSERLTTIHKNVRSVLQQEQVSFIDLLDEWMEKDFREFRREDNTSDFVHPNKAGHRFAARCLSEWFNKRGLIGVDSKVGE